MYFYIYCDIFTLFDSVSFTLQCSDQNYYNPNWNHVTHSPPWTLKCLSRRALLKKKKKLDPIFSRAVLEIHSPQERQPFFSSRPPETQPSNVGLVSVSHNWCLSFQNQSQSRAWSAGVQQGRGTRTILFNKRELIVQKEGSVCPPIWNLIIKSGHVPFIYPVL